MLIVFRDTSAGADLGLVELEDIEDVASPSGVLRIDQVEKRCVNKR